MRESVGRLDEKVAVIIGGGRGIGRAAALLLARAGAAVVVAARRASDCEEVAASITSEGGRALAVAADAAAGASIEDLAAKTTDWAGPPDILVVTAGAIQPAGKVWEVSPDQWAGCVQVNLVGAFNTLRAFLPAMVVGAAGAGGAPPRGATVVLVSTGVTRFAVPGWSAYGAAKSGLDYLGRNLQAEIDLEELPISVYTVYPGVVDTPMQETIRGMTPEEFPDVERIRRMHEEGRLRPPEQPATLIWWLAALGAADLRGQVVDIGSPDIRGRVAADLGLPQF
jgi:3-oxoacyl-[acyl-carrier protein] reductase